MPAAKRSIATAPVPAAAPRAGTAPAAKKAAAAKSASVLSLHKAKGGKVYRVLAPAVTPRHLSGEDIDRLVDLMVAAR